MRGARKPLLVGSGAARKPASSQTRARHLQTELIALEKQIEQFLDRLVDADGDSVIKAYERRIKKLENQKIVLKEKIESSGRPLTTFDDSLRTAIELLANPWKLWESGELEHRRMVLKPAFGQPLAYVRNEGFRTANFAWPFRAFSQFAQDEFSMVVVFNTPPYAHPTENDLTSAPGSARSYPLTPSASLLYSSHFPTAVRRCPRTWLVAEIRPECRLPSQPGALSCRRSPSTKSNSPNAGESVPRPYSDGPGRRSGLE